MANLILLRHGQSLWNLENRFTGWTDVDLSEEGIKEARTAGKILAKNLLGYCLYVSSKKGNKDASYSRSGNRLPLYP